MQVLSILKASFTRLFRTKVQRLQNNEHMHLEDYQKVQKVKAVIFERTGATVGNRK